MNNVIVTFKLANSTRFLDYLQNKPENRWHEQTAGLKFSIICNLKQIDWALSLVYLQGKVRAPTAVWRNSKHSHPVSAVGISLILIWGT